MKINKFSNDLPKEIVSQIKDSIAIDTEATGLKIPERDKLSLIQICDANGEVYVIQPDRKTYKAPNLVSILENDKILNCKKKLQEEHQNVRKENELLKERLERFERKDDNFRKEIQNLNFNKRDLA